MRRQSVPSSVWDDHRSKPGTKPNRLVHHCISLSLSLSLYIYIYICVCVCVCELKLEPGPDDDRHSDPEPESKPDPSLNSNLTLTLTLNRICAAPPRAPEFSTHGLMSTFAQCVGRSPRATSKASKLWVTVKLTPGQSETLQNSLQKPNWTVGRVVTVYMVAWSGGYIWMR